MSYFGIPTSLATSIFWYPYGPRHILVSLRVNQDHILVSLRANAIFWYPYGPNMSYFGIPTGQTCHILVSLQGCQCHILVSLQPAIYHSRVIPSFDIPLLRLGTSSHSPPEPARVVIYPFLLNTILSTMSDDYDEPSRRGMSALYLAGTVVGTILVLAAFKATFDIDIIGRPGRYRNFGTRPASNPRRTSWKAS